MTELYLLLLALMLVGLNALFVCAEFSFITVDRSAVEKAADSGDARAVALLPALRTLSTQLSGAQLGITVSSLVVGYLAEPSLAALLRGPLEGLGIPDGAAGAVAVGLALVLATVTQMVLGELVPKNLAIARPDGVARFVVRPQRLFTTLSRPLLAVLNRSSNAVLRLFGIEPQEELDFARAPRELASVAARSGQQGTLDRTTASLVARAVAFGDRTAADAMTPRPRVHFVAADAPAGEVIALAARTGFARFPVTGPRGVDDIVGVVHFKHVVGLTAEQRGATPVDQVMAQILAVPASMELDPLLAQLRRPGLQLALVVDEYGGTDGIVTLEDLVEEIVGEIVDEQDGEADRVRPMADGSHLLSGLLRPDEVAEATGVGLPEGEETDTVGGLLTERLGRLPLPGDEVVLTARDTAHRDDDDLPTPVLATLRVRSVQQRRVRRVLLSTTPVPPAEPEQDA